MSIHLRQKPLKDGRKSLYLDIYYSGNRQYEFLNLYLTQDRAHNKETKELAKSILHKRELEIQASGYGLTPQFKRKVDFLTYFKTVWRHKVDKEGLRGEYNYTTTYKHLKDFSGGSVVQIGAIDKKWLERFRSFIIDKGIKPTTTNNYFNRVKAVLERAVQEGFIPSNPAKGIKYYQCTQTEIAFLSIDEVQRLSKTECERPQVKYAFLFCCLTGLRFSDVKHLTWDQIKDDRIHFQQRKTLQFEYVPLSESAIQLLAAQRTDTSAPYRPEQPVFNIPDKSHVNAFLKSWARNADIDKNLTFHMSRHTFATSLLTAGTDLYTVSKLLGHKSISSTQIYAKVVDTLKTQAVKKLPEIRI